ncbi:NAD(P)-dependent dehydrogenase (short-subunit alcohol dehydrogenase family) [Ancylobacter sp. 3268]|uniref:SDR family NAD(P)-dependent oxidoreductase n=1 Tax=Ancylobacter sp. 3268 TaxID=2817752 RepID=UPI002860897F|nr:SDR family oxidoreductase [Ancylobacter sp. 3268]MDR6950932.1 NAD(P)-dependent dehydrogenase (short-subunit alcohol dehydrogenase family) [Ancylobacter sp. 3268]
MKIDLSGKSALVTGSTEGIGFAIAKGLHDAGATVVVNGRTQAKVDAAVVRLGGSARGRAADLATAEGVTALVAAEPAFDIVVNNLGIFQPVDFFEADDEVWERHWQVNVMASVRVARAYLPGMAEKGWGRLLFLSSESGFNIPVEMIHYGVSKTADVAVARGLAKRMAGTGVTVNSILPGPTLSEGVAAMLKEEVAAGKTLEQAGADFVKAHRPGSLIGRPASVEEVANMAVYIASPLASATTGAALRVDGGLIDFIV